MNYEHYENIDKAWFMVLKDVVSYQEGQIVSQNTGTKNEAVSITHLPSTKAKKSLHP